MWFDDLSPVNEKVFADKPMGLLKGDPVFSRIHSLANLEDDNTLKAYVRDKFFVAKSNEVDDRPVFLKTVVFPLNLNVGSTDSMRFHEKLRDLGGSDVLLTPSIKRVIEYKWERVGNCALFRLAFYLVYMVFIVFYPFKLRVVLFFTLSKIAEMIFTLYNGVSGVSTYFRGFWNVIDLMRISFAIWFLFIHFQGYGDVKCTKTNLTAACNYKLYERRSYALMNLFSWFSMLGFLRMDRYFGLRVFVALIVQVLWGITPFLIFNFLCLMGLTTTMHFASFISLTDKQDELWNTFTLFYRMFFGEPMKDFIAKPGDKFTMCLWIASVFFMFLVMANIVIAIITDIHNEVIDSRTKNDLRELNGFILELEVWWCWNRKKTSRTHLIWAEYDDEIAMKWEGRSKMTSMRITKSIKKMENNFVESFKHNHLNRKVHFIASMRKTIADLKM